VRNAITYVIQGEHYVLESDFGLVRGLNVFIRSVSRSSGMTNAQPASLFRILSEQYPTSVFSSPYVGAVGCSDLSQVYPFCRGLVRRCVWMKLKIAIKVVLPYLFLSFRMDHRLHLSVHLASRPTLHLRLKRIRELIATMPAFRFLLVLFLAAWQVAAMSVC
jgi:hypothetical protein